MEKNIYATLDLTLSLSDFQAQVTKLLELTNVRERLRQEKGRHRVYQLKLVSYYLGNWLKL